MTAPETVPSATPEPQTAPVQIRDEICHIHGTRLRLGPAVGEWYCGDVHEPGGPCSKETPEERAESVARWTAQLSADTRPSLGAS